MPLTNPPLREGTAFPGSPPTGMEFKRTDRGGRIYRYDGAYWIGISQYPMILQPYDSLNPFSASPGIPGIVAIPDGWAGMWIDRITYGVQVSGGNNVSNYWTLALSASGPGGYTGALGSVDTSAMSSGAWYTLPLTSPGGNPFVTTTYCELYVSASATGSPGVYYFTGTALVREVG